MAKRYCVWCGKDAKYESNGEYCVDGMYCIHYDCFNEVRETAEDIKQLMNILKNSDEFTPEAISFIERVERFQRRADGVEKLLRMGNNSHKEDVK